MEEKLMPKISFSKYCKDKYLLDMGDYEIKVEDGKTYMVKKKPKYPKSYKECCDVLGLCTMDNNDAKGYKCELIIRFQKLLIARDAYWKIAGAEIGLGKPWKPDWTNTNSNKYCIYYVGDEIKKQPMLEVHHFLAFPTAEMRNVFYENFKELIEQCKELLR